MFTFLFLKQSYSQVLKGSILLFQKNKTTRFSKIYRSSHRRCSMKEGVLKNCAKFTGKHLCQSPFFNKVAGLWRGILLKKTLWHRCFPVNFAKFIRTPFLQNTTGRLLLNLAYVLKYKALTK